MSQPSNVYAFPVAQQPPPQPQPQVQAMYPSGGPPQYPTWGGEQPIQGSPPPQQQAPAPQAPAQYPQQAQAAGEDPIPVKLARLANQKAQQVPWWIWIGVGVGVTYYLTRKARGKPIFSFGG